MKNKIILAAAFALAASAANAADGKFYLKANAGYGMSKQHADAPAPIGNIKKSGKGFVGTVGVGTNLSSMVRTDIEFYMDDGIRAKQKAINSKMKTNSYAGLVNVYYDFKNTSKITPFVMGGVGYGHNKYKINAVAAGRSFSFSSKANGFAYQAGAGLGFDAGKATFELGYRYIDKGAKNKTLNNQGVTVRAKKTSGKVHAILAGLRVGF